MAKKRSYIPAKELQPAAETDDSPYNEIFSLVGEFPRCENIDREALRRILLTALEIARQAELVNYSRVMWEGYVFNQGRTDDQKNMVLVPSVGEKDKLVVEWYRDLLRMRLQREAKYPKAIIDEHIKLITPGMLFRDVFTANRMMGADAPATLIITALMLCQVVQQYREGKFSDEVTFLNELEGVNRKYTRLQFTAEEREILRGHLHI